jgi:pimeloyl-ACP methyl ester carboxylesterase
VPAFVLIPGAGTDPRVYRATIEALVGLGHEAVAPELPLDDEEATPSDHGDAVAAAAPSARGLVVVAQTLGAFIGVLVITRVPVAQLVLLAPMVPRPGETAGAWWENTGHAEAIADALERLGQMSAGARGLDRCLSPRRRSRRGARERGVQRAAGVFSEPWPLERWPDVPTRVLAPREGRLFPLAFQRRVARERLGLEVDQMAGGHLPMLSRPDELAERLVELTT